MLPPDFNEVIPQILGVFDEPFADYSSIPSLAIYKIISKKNKVAISQSGYYLEHLKGRINRLKEKENRCSYINKNSIKKDE